MSKFFKKLALNYQKARTKDVLMQMSDRSLKDIGINRGMIHSHVEELYSK